MPGVCVCAWPVSAEHPCALFSSAYLFFSSSRSLLSFVRVIVIERMAKPEEVIIVLDEYGQPRRMRVDDAVDSLQHFQVLPALSPFHRKL